MDNLKSVQKAFLPARDNHFSTRYTDALLFRFSGSETWASVSRHFEELGFNAAVTGSKGSGKTTFMLQFARYMKAKGFSTFYLRLNEGRKFTQFLRLREVFKKIGAAEILFLDGFEQLGVVSRVFLRWKSRSIKGLLISCHMMAPCAVLLHCETSPELLRELIGSVTGNEQFISLEDSELLLEKSSGNIRDALRALYDREATISMFPLQQ